MIHDEPKDGKGRVMHFEGNYLDWHEHRCVACDREPLGPARITEGVISSDFYQIVEGVSEEVLRKLDIKETSE